MFVKDVENWSDCGKPTKEFTIYHNHSVFDKLYDLNYIYNI